MIIDRELNKLWDTLPFWFFQDALNIFNYKSDLYFIRYGFSKMYLCDLLPYTLRLIEEHGYPINKLLVLYRPVKTGLANYPTILVILSDNPALAANQLKRYYKMKAFL